MDASSSEPLASPESPAPRPDTGSARPKEPLRLLPGRVVPGTRYRIVRWLGEGGMGVVYEATHLDIERKAALKLLRIPQDLDPEIAQQFRDEARRASRVGSENIAEIFDFAELSDGRLMYAMENVRGESLASLLENGPIAPDRAIPILRQIAKGLMAAHAAGIVHCDVKPENILLTTREDGREDLVKLVDFGIARLMDDRSQEASSAGTPAYMAPEQVLGMAFDDRLDQYALACTAYEMLVGSPPFGMMDVDEILRAQINTEPPPLESAATEVGCPAALAAVVHRAMSKNADERYADMRDFEGALCDAQITAGLETAWDDLPLPDIEPEWRAYLLSAMPNSDETEPQRRTWLWPAIGGALATLIGVGVWSMLDRSPDEVVMRRIDALVSEADGAAAAAYWVYPPADRPGGTTAFRKVEEIDEIDGAGQEAADERAQELRSKYHATLSRLGDRYWEREGGRPFASDYYAQAALFDPSDERARERAGWLPGELADLRRKATDGGFADYELQAATALVIMADDDDARVVQRLEELEEEVVISGHRAALLDRLTEGESGTPAPRVAGVDANAGPDGAVNPVAIAPPSAELPDEPGSDPTQGGPAEDVGSSKRDAAASKKLSRKAHKVLASGDESGAERLYNQALALDNRNTGALMGLSDLAFARGRYEDSIRPAQRAVRLSPNKGSYRISLGDAFFKSFRYADAKREYEAADRLGDPKAKARLSKVQARLGG